MMSAYPPLAWLPQGILIPTLVGLGAGLVIVLAFHFLVRGRQAPPPAEAPRPEPEYDPFVQGSASEQRSAFRRTGNPVEVQMRKPGSVREPARGHVINRSTGGLCLAVDVMIPEGTVLELRPTNAPPITPWTEVEVRSCRRTQDGWEAGCKFVRTPPWAMLLMFG